MTNEIVRYNIEQRTITGIETTKPGALFVEITIKKTESGYELANQKVCYLKDYINKNDIGLIPEESIIQNLISDVKTKILDEYHDDFEEGGGYEGGFKNKNPLLIENNLDIDLNDVYKLPTTIYGKTGNNRKSKNKTLNIRK